MIHRPILLFGPWLEFEEEVTYDSDFFGMIACLSDAVEELYTHLGFWEIFTKLLPEF